MKRICSGLVCAAICSPTPEPKFACEEGELTPLGECRAAHCGSVPPEMLKACVVTNCGKAFSELSDTCRTCVLSNDGKPPQEVAALCLPPIPPAPAPLCAATELDALTACAGSLCASAMPADKHQCALQQCFSSYVSLSQQCMACLAPDKDLATAKERCVKEVTP